VDAVCDGLAVTFEIRHVTGADGDRIAAIQARAISALLAWLATETTGEAVADIHTATGGAGNEHGAL
jgi:hypothetical protein